MLGQAGLGQAPKLQGQKVPEPLLKLEARTLSCRGPCIES